MNREYTGNRFKGESDVIDMDKLEKETQKLLFLGLLVAVSFHAALGSYFIFRKTEVRVVKPPSMELVIRRPRMTKPFEFKKQRIKEREYKKQDIAQRKPSAEINTKSVQTNLLGSVTTYEFGTDMDVSIGEVFIPESVEIDMSTTREPEKQISMKEEMISINDLDTGQYKAMVIQDPADKQSITGFVYISTLWGAQLEPAYKRSIIHLADAVNRWTSINAKVDRHLFIDSRRIFDSPIVFLCADDQFEITDIEAENLRNYLLQGGFAVFDNGNPTEEYSAAEASLRKAIRVALGSQAKFLPIPNDHAIYHSFFDFEDGAPQGSEVDVASWYVINNTGNDAMSSVTSYKQVLYLEGISIDGRLVVLYSDKGYSRNWEEDTNNEPQLKFGVNTVVFALTQEGSIAQQKMDFFSDSQ